MPNDFGLKPGPQPGKHGPKANWPAWYYGPNEGEQRICNGPDDVPDGWGTSRANAKAKVREQLREAPAERMSRDAIISELKTRKVKYNYAKANTGELWQLLRDLREHEGPLEATATAPGTPGGGPAAKAAGDE